MTSFMSYSVFNVSNTDETVPADSSGAPLVSPWVLPWYVLHNLWLLCVLLLFFFFGVSFLSLCLSFELWHPNIPLVSLNFLHRMC
jgi:hypothetical protein